MPFLPGTMTAPSGPELLQDLSAEAGRTAYNVGHAQSRGAADDPGG
jgi:hypothetical protein